MMLSDIKQKPRFQEISINQQTTKIDKFGIYSQKTEKKANYYFEAEMKEACFLDNLSQ